MDLFDLHCDTITACYQQNKALDDTSNQFSLSKRGELGRVVQCFAVFCENEKRGIQAFEYYQRCVACYRAQCELFRDALAPCKTDADVQKALFSGHCAGVLTVENGNVLAGKPETLDVLAADGVKAMTLTWNGENELAGGVGSDSGLTALGLAVAARMHQLGIALDVSHLCDQSLDELLRKTEYPLIASHSNLRAVCEHPRNLTDDQFRAIAARGGLVGLNLNRPFLSEDGAPTIDHLLRHIDRGLRLGGEDVLASGSDFDGALMPAFFCDLSYAEGVIARVASEFGRTIANKIYFQNAYDFFFAGGKGAPCLSM